MSTTYNLLKAKQKKLKQEMDPVTAVVHHVENLTEPAAMTLLGELVEQRAEDTFRLGGVLTRIREEKWYKSQGCNSFEEFVEERYGMGRHKARHLSNIYLTLTGLNVPWDAVKHVGWSKLRLLVPILSEETFDYWLAQAETLTYRQLQEAVKAHLANGDTCHPNPTNPSSAVKPKTFKCHADQLELLEDALAKCKEETGTEYDTVALERICLGYLAGTISAAPAPLTQLEHAIQQVGDIEKVLGTIEKLYPDVNITVEM